MYEDELIEAIVNDNAKEVENLLEVGAEPNGVVDGFLLRPLHFAVTQASVDIIQLLVAAGADVNLADIDGVTPPQLASILYAEL